MPDSSGRPTPGDMPRRRLPRVPTPPPRRVPHSVRYQVNDAIPQCGWSDATLWLDAGILVFAGTDPETLERTSRHVGTRARVARAVDREVRGLARTRPDIDAPDVEHQRYAAATAAVGALLLGGLGVPIEELHEEELSLIEPIRSRLAALSNERTKRHGGEAELIVIAAREARSGRRRHVIMTNDAGASVVAGERGLPARHSGHILAEISCQDPELDAARCWALFQKGHTVSGVARNARPRGPDDFTCRRSGSTCEHCTRS